ncbi:unnamed protein product [Orchesella dallaii]|uniref:Uncharacterized protein n=1 Tax=Orchesella dallaii TaxID=48710 RepID=A0ABP1PZN1_9HEXA
MGSSCCMSSQRGVKILAIIDAVLSVLNLGLFALGVIGLLVYDDELDITERQKRIATGAFVIGIVISILQILLAFRLFYGAKNRDYRNCRIWITVTIVVVVINTASLILNWTAGEPTAFVLGITAFLICYKIFEIVVVLMFLRTLGTDGQAGNGIIYATAAAPQPPPYYPAQQQAYATSAFPQSQYPLSNQQNNLYPVQQMGPVIPHNNVNYPVIPQKSTATHVV